MQTEPKPLSEDVLEQLTVEALVAFLGGAQGFEAALHPGCALALSGEPVADLNMLVVGRGGEREGRFARAVEGCLEREQPFLALVFPAAGEPVAAQAAALGLVHAVEFPFMVREDAPEEPSGAADVQVEPAGADAHARGFGRAVAAAFKMPEQALVRAVPAARFASPALDGFLALRGGECVGGVILTHHGDVTGVWAMGVDPACQARGVGRRLLTSAMADARARGSRRFFLGATPAGRPLYERLGYTTRLAAQVWVSGETGQA